MNASGISMNEIANDGKTIHVYFDGMTGFFTAYGLSAFYADHVVSPILSYSADMQMPVALMTRNDIKELRQSCKLIESQGDDYCRLETKQVLGEDGYQKWAERLR